MRRRFIAIVVTGLLGSVSSGAAVAAPAASTTFGGIRVAHGVPRHGLGLIVRPHARTSPSRLRVASAPPAAVDLSSWAPPVGDQGQVGSCVTWAIAYGAAGWYANVQHRLGAPFAPMYVYSQINGGVDEGSSPSDAYSLMQSQGVPSQSVYSQGNYDWQTQPTTAERTNAALHTTTAGQFLFYGDNQGDAARTAIETALAANHPVSLSIPVYDAFFQLDSNDYLMSAAKVSGTSAGGHEITAYGYDADGLMIENSWGTQWGLAGWAKLSWDFVDTYVMDASYLSAGFAADTQAPTITSVIASIHSGAASAVVTASDHQSTIAGYSYVWDHLPTSASLPATANTTSPTITATLAAGTWYVHVRAIDAAGNPSAIVTAALQPDTTSPRMTGLTVRIASSRSYAVAASATDDVGVTGYQWVWNTSGTSASGTGHTTSARTFASPLLAKGTWYVHVRARDAAGHWSPWRGAGGYASPTRGGQVFTGTLSKAGAQSTRPSTGVITTTVSGTFLGHLSGPSNTDFDLYLYKWSGTAWTLMAKSRGLTSTESIAFTGSPGSYLWLVYSYTGSGSFTLDSVHP